MFTTFWKMLSFNISIIDENSYIVKYIKLIFERTSNENDAGH